MNVYGYVNGKSNIFKNKEIKLKLSEYLLVEPPSLNPFD